MNPIKKNNYQRAAYLVLLIVGCLTIFQIQGVDANNVSLFGWVFPSPWVVFMVSFEVAMFFYGVYWSPSDYALSPDEVRLVLRDYPELKSWVGSLLNRNELVTLDRLYRVTSEIASEEAEKQRIAKANSLLEEQRRAFK